MISFSRFQVSFMAETRSRSSAISLSTSARRFFEASSRSLASADCSMSRPVSLRSSWSIGSGKESISILRRLAASSTRSMALSGSCRPEM